MMKRNRQAWRQAALLPFACMAHTALQAAEPIQLSPVVVSAVTPAEESKRALQAEQALTPGGVTLLESEELYQRNISNMSDMLRYVPGVWTASVSGSDSSFISVRGSNLDAVDYDGNGVKLMQDGLPVSAADGNNHNRFMDPLNARHTIVARGANALTYGASTLGGAIDFITPTALDSPPLEVFFNGGSFGQVQSRISAGKVAGDFDGLVTVEAKHRDGYREHNEQDRNGVYANAGWQLGNKVRTRFYLTQIQNDEELPGVLTREQWHDDPRQAEAAAVDGNYQWNVQTTRVANKTTWDIDAESSLSFGLSYEKQNLYHPIVYAPPFFTLLVNTEQQNYGTSLRYNLRKGEHDMLAGLNYAQMDVSGGNYENDRGNRGALRTRVDNDADSLEIFLMDRWRFAPQWTAVYGAQGVLANREVRNVDVASGALSNPKDDYSSINPRAGLIYQLTPEVELFTNLSRLYEAPTTYQLEDGISGSDKALAAMHGNVIEVGTRGTQKTGKSLLRWDVALYYAKLRDEILSVDGPSPGTGDSLALNVDKTTHAGIEALLGGSFPLDDAGSHRIEPLLSLTLNHFRFDGDAAYGNNKLPAAPDYALRGEILYRNAEGFFFGPTVDFVGDRYADFSNNYTVDSYTLWGLRAGLVRKGWELYAEIRNLTDENYIARHSVKDIAAPDAAILSPGEPRSAYLGVRLMY